MLLTLLKTATGGSVTAPTFSNLTSSGASSNTSFTTASMSPAGNCLILVTVHAYISTGSLQPPQPTVTGNGITYALVQAQDVDTAGTDRATMWVFRGMAASPTTGAVTISFGATSMTRCSWSVDESDANVNTNGVNGAGAIYQATGVTVASGTSASVNYAATEQAKNGSFSAWAHQVQEVKTPQSGWTELADVTAVSLASLETQYKAGTDTGGSATWATSSRAGGIILEIATPPVLLAAYSFDEVSGPALDASGNGHDVTLAGSSLTRVTGHTNTAVSQTSAAADSPGPLSGMQTQFFTVMGWVKRTVNLVDGWLMEFKQAGSGDRGILYTSGNIQSRCKNVAGTVFTVQTTQPTQGTAYHVACTNDGTTLRLFINGTEVGTGTAFSGGVRTNSTSSSLFDGCGTETWLDDARYYDAALDAAAITALMGTPVGGTGGVVTADAALTETATLTGSGTSAKPVDSSLSPSTSLTATGTSSKPVAGALSATASLSASATVGAAPKLIDAALSVTASLAASETTAKFAGGALASTATLAATGTSTKPADAALAVTSNRSADTGAAAALSETATLNAAGTSTKPVTGSLAATAALTATLSTAGQQTADASLSETASLSAAAASAKPIAGTLAVSTTLTATGIRERVAAGAPTVTATLTSAVQASKPALAGVTVTAGLSAGVTVLRSAAAQLAATAILTATGDSYGGVTYRPNTGTTSKPAGGTTPRPFTGTTSRP